MYSYSFTFFQTEFLELNELQTHFLEDFTLIYPILLDFIKNYYIRILKWKIFYFTVVWFEIDFHVSWVIGTILFKLGSFIALGLTYSLTRITLALWTTLLLTVRFGRVATRMFTLLQSLVGFAFRLAVTTGATITTASALVTTATSRPMKL